MSLLKKLSYTTATAALVAMASTAAVHAQVTTAEIRGSVIDAAGNPISGATVQVIHQPTGTSSTTTTGSSGSFSARGLRPGGPYIVIATAPGYQGGQAEDLFASLGNPLSVNIALDSGAGDTIVVTGSRLITADVAVGPSAVFDATDLANAPAINRDLKDIVRLDPRVYLDESFNDSIQCAGAHPRFNSLTVDGIGLNDGFGLNSNGYPTERMPFPYAAIQQVSVELAPFDVQYGGFTACNINAVTRSGTNEFRGDLFYDYTDDNLQGADAAPFDEQRYGVSFGGPIIEDRLFFFAAYERFEGVNQFFRGPDGSGATVEVAGFTQAEYDQILNIARNVYQYDPGGIPQSAAAIDEKYLIRLDWNIAENHRASLTYNFSEGLNLNESDGDSTEFEYANHLYNRGAAPLQAYALQVFSDWTDNFSTELRIAYNDVDFVQSSVNGTDFGEVQIRDGANTIYLGADDSRHSNDLDYSTLQIRLAGSYAWNEHLFTAGYERLTFDIFNLFVQHTEGEWRFNSIADFQAGRAARVYYGNAAGTNNPADAGATFAYDVHTLYAQDEFQPHPDVTVTAGLRYEWYTSEDRPNENPNFIARNGFTNAFNLDGVDLIQPRLGVQWDVNDQLTVRGGIGLYSGGNPNVWVSNSYSNDGITNVQLLDFNVDLFTRNFVQDEGSATGRPIWGILDSQFNAVATGASNSTVNAIDPNFETPSEWKFAVGATYDFDMPFLELEDQTRLLVDVLYSQSRDGVLVRDIALEQVGASAADGRPIYRRIDRSDPDCRANPGTVAAPNPACTYRGFNNDLLLTNSEGGQQFVFSALLQHDFANDVDFSLGYAYVDSTDVNPMTSSVAFSNWVNIATSDINNPSEATSNYEIPHRFTMRLSWERAFFGEFMTRATLFGQAFQARPWSWTFGGNTNSDMFGDGQEYVHLLYVPTVGDPNVTYAASWSAADQAAFDAFVAQYGLARGQIVERNGEEGSWSNKFDLRLEQEFRGILPGHTSSAFLVIENVGNLINEDWGIISQAGFPQRIGVVDAAIDPATGRYIFQDFFAPTPERVVGDVSFWTVRMGLRYEF